MYYFLEYFGVKNFYGHKKLPKRLNFAQSGNTDCLTDWMDGWKTFFSTDDQILKYGKREKSRKKVFFRIRMKGLRSGDVDVDVDDGDDDDDDDGDDDANDNYN